MSRLIGVLAVGSAGCWLWFVTVTEAEALLPLPPSVEVTGVVMLFCAPGATAETLTVKLQLALAGRVAPDRLMLGDPAFAVIVPVLQLPFRPLGVATISPAGIVSVKPIPLKEDEVFGLESEKVREVVPFSATSATANAIVKLGGWMAGGGGPDPPEELPPHA